MTRGMAIMAAGVLGALAGAGPAAADGFHNPPFQGVKPEVWEKKMRTRLRIPKKVKKTAVTGGKSKTSKKPPETPKKPPLTTEELGGVIVHLIDLLRYLDPVNINPTEFPEVAANIKAYREKVKELLADLGPKGVGYLVEALINELRARRKGEGRRVPQKLLGRDRANRGTWNTTGNDEMLPSPQYVDDLVEVLRLIGWDALREALRRRGEAADPKVQEDLTRVLDATAAKFPQLFRKGLADTDAAVRRSTQQLLGRTLKARFGEHRDLASQLVESLITDLRAAEPAQREAALGLLRGLTGQDFGRDQIEWRAWWGSSIPVLAYGGVRAVPELIQRLTDPEPLARVVAARHLKRLCGTGCGFKESYWARGGDGPIARGVKKWRAFWAKNATRLIETEAARREKKNG